MSYPDIREIGGEPPEAILAEPVTSMSFFTAVSATNAFQWQKLHSTHAV